MNFMGYKRENGTVGIRNKILIIAVDECCEGIARTIGKKNEDTVILTNWATCMLGGNEESFNQMIAVGKNPNVAGVLIIAMGCGSILPESIERKISETRKKVECITCSELGGTRKSVEIGIKKLKNIENYIKGLKREVFPMSDLVIGVKCGGSDTSSGIAFNPSVGLAVDKMVEMGAICIAGELFELLGCDKELNERAESPEVAKKIERLIQNEKVRWSVEGTEIETMSIGNSIGGLTTIEEKSLGALHKTGTKPIIEILQINKDFIDYPKKPGFYLSEVTMVCGGAGVNFASLGAHLILWTTGSAGFNNEIVPVIRVSGNKDLINDDIDIDASGIMEGTKSINEISEMIIKEVKEVGDGKPTRIEGIGDSTMTLYQKDQRLENLLKLKCVK